MKAIVHHKYGSPNVLKLEEIEKPVPADDEVLVRVYTASLNILDWYGISGLGIARVGGGFRQPKDPRVGVDFAGVIETVGANVKQFRPGDEVYGGRGGSFAEYVTVREQRGIASKPADMTFEQAATIPVAGLTALQGLRDKGQVRPGQKVLINGASGGVGTFAVQIAKAFGAEVTGVCHTRHVDPIRSLGGDHVFDYAREDFTRSGQRYDLVLDVMGGRSWRDFRRVLKPNATFVLIGGPKTNRLIGPLAHILKIRLAALRASQKILFFIANVNREDLLLASRSSLPYPYPYGFFIGTSAADGENVDCYLITHEKIKRGSIIECEPIGLLEQIEDGQIDHKVLAALPGETVEAGPELLEELRDFIYAVFAQFPEVSIRIGRILAREEALSHIGEIGS